MDYKISIIVPIFNAELFLENLINSLLKQTIGFENIELILVDDCSTDKSKEIITNFSIQYKNIKPIFLNKNSGNPSIPRNIGINESTAPYIQFLDNDDDIHKDYCKILYDVISSNDVDIVNCSHSNKLNNNIYVPKEIEYINKDLYFVNDDEKMFLGYTVWGNIYSSIFIKKNKIKFPKTLFEDGVFSLMCLSKTNKPVISIKNYPGYIYLIENNDSITHDVTDNTLRGFIEGYNICYNLLSKYSKVIIEKNLINFINMSIFILIKLDNPKNGIEILSNYENSLNEKIVLSSFMLNILNNKIVNKKFKQSIFLIKILRYLYNCKMIRNYIFVKFNNLKLIKNIDKYFD